MQAAGKPVCFPIGQSTTVRNLNVLRRCARDAQRKFCRDTTETEITACCSWSEEQGWVMIALSPEKRLPRSRLIWCMVTEVSDGSVRGILLEKTFAPACPVTL